MSRFAFPPGRTVVDRAGAAWLMLACLWAAAVAFIGWHQWQFWRAPRLVTDVFALLPADDSRPVATRATQALLHQADGRIIVMLGAADWSSARRAAGAFQASVEAGVPSLHAVVAQGALPGDALAFYAPYRDRLLTPAQRAALQHPDTDSLTERALARLHGITTAQPTAWLADPLGLWPAWWAERSGLTRARPRDGVLWVAAEAPSAVGQAPRSLEWAVLLYEADGAAFRFDGDNRWSDALATGERAARQAVPDLYFVAAGSPLHAEAGAVQGSREANTIGWGSLAAVCLLVWATFRSWRPLGLVAVSLAIGCAAGASATVLVFGSIHMLTLVFGASLVGVAEDFGLHYFASRLGRAEMASTQRRALLRGLLPGLSLALLTSVLGYLVLGVAPFPGLREMAVFSSVGLCAAFLTVVLWFPWLDRGPLPAPRLAQVLSRSLSRWPRATGGRTRLVLVALALLTLTGLLRLRVSDDVRQLQASPPRLMAAQITIGRILQVPSPAQFFTVQGVDTEQVLQREEALATRLAQLVQLGKLGGWSAVSDWVPSQARQREGLALTAAVERPLLQRLGEQLGESLVRPGFASGPLQVDAWLAHPVSVGVRAQWLGALNGGYASAVLLRGLDPAALADVKAAGEALPGVQWVDRTSDFSSLLGRYRYVLSLLLVGGHVAVWGLLVLRFGRQAWRAWAPTVAASLMALAVLGWTGQPLQLFHVLGLVLVLGMGVDYGIFLLEHTASGEAWLAVLIGAGSTVLSFGLLALSATPALHAFGLTMLCGISGVVLLAPLLRPPDAAGFPPTFASISHP